MIFLQTFCLTCDTNDFLGKASSAAIVDIEAEVKDIE